MKLIYTSYSPNTRTKDLLVNLKALLQPWAWQKGQYQDRIINWFKSQYGASSAFTFNYARSALYVLFKSLNLNPDDEVIVQGFTCVAAVNPIRWAGAKVKFVDIDPDTLSLGSKKLKEAVNPHTKAILVQHTFGIPGPIEEVVELAKDQNIIVIEDCANTILGATGTDLSVRTGRDPSLLAIPYGS